MKRAWIAATLILSLLMPGCASLLEREYVSSTRHVDYHVGDDPSILQAESYQGLVSALFYFLEAHADTGVVHLSNYVGDIATDLDAACAEVLEEDPIGAYALDGIEHTHTRIVSYYEVTFTFDYAHTAEEMAQVRSVAGNSGLLQAVGEAIASFEERCVVSVSYFTGDEAGILTEARQLWLDAPLVLAEPELRVKLYPDSGRARVVEVTLTWPEDPDELKARRSATLAAAQRLLQELDLPAGERPAPALLASALRERVAVDRAGPGSSAYDALVGGAANGQGTAFALMLLCQQAGVEATVVEGRLAGEAAYWLIVETGEGMRHLDPSAELPPEDVPPEDVPPEDVPPEGTPPEDPAPEEIFLCAVDEEFRALGYEWSSERYPACEAPEGQDPPEDGADGEDAEGPEPSPER